MCPAARSKGLWWHGVQEADDTINLGRARGGVLWVIGPRDPDAWMGRTESAQPHKLAAAMNSVGTMKL